MECDGKQCHEEMSLPLLTVNVGDQSAGAYWGNYCSYVCAQTDIGGAWTHLAEGGTLEQWNTIGLEDVLATPTSTPTTNAQTVQPESNESDNVFDGMADAEKVSYVRYYIEEIVEEFSSQLSVHFSYEPLDVEMNGDVYTACQYEGVCDTPAVSYTVRVDATHAQNQEYPNDSLLRVRISFPDYPDKNFTALIDPAKINANDVIAPLVGHIQTVGTALASEPVSNTATASAGEDPF